MSLDRIAGYIAVVIICFVLLCWFEPPDNTET